MEPSLLNQWFSHGEIKAICWTLIHSLWIGMIIALLAALVIMFTRKSGANLRYRLLCGILVLFVVSVSVIFCIELRSTGSAQSNPGNIKFFINPVNINITDDGTLAIPTNPLKVMVNFLDSYINVIFITWLLFFMLKSLKMVSGLLYIKRIRTYRIHEVTKDFKHKIELFSRQIGIRRTVCLVQSELVKVPVAVGWLKPMILLPIGVIFQLSVEQLDSILWHELAHIYRRDYLVNILQGLVEVVFFFNPGLLWLSALIRAEREACCDDMVLGRMNHKANYLEALLSFGFDGHKTSGLAMGIGSGNQLRDRLKRMISRENKRLGVIEKVALITGVVALSAFAGLTKANKKYTPHLINAAIEKAAPARNKMPAAVGGASSPQNIKTVMPGVDPMNNKADTSVNLFDRQYKWSQSEPGVTYSVSAEDTTGTKYRFTITKFKLVALTVNGIDVQKRDLRKYAHLLKNVPPPPPPPPTQPTPPPGASNDKTDTLKIGYFSVRSNRADDGTTIIYHAKAEDNHGKNYHFVAADYKLMSMTINGKKIMESDLPKYEYVVRAVLERQWAMQKASIEYIQQQRNKLQPQEPQPPQAPPVAPTGRADTLSLVHLTMASNRNVADKISTDKVHAEDNQGKNYYFIITNDKVTSMDIDGEKIKDSDLPKYQYMVRLVREKQRASANQIKKPVDLIRQPDKPQQPQPPQAPPSLDKMIADVTNDLINEHIIKDKSGLLTIKLTYAELVVNGVKQPDEIQKKFAAKYYPGNARVSKDPNYGLWYNARTHGVALGTFNLDLDSL